MTATTWEEAAEETAATLKRDVIKLWTERNVNALNATRQVLASLGDEPGQYPPVQGFRHIAENGIVGVLKLHGDTTEIDMTVRHVVQTVIKKQHDYGHGNIEAYGRLGLLVRLSDKCARIENLVKRSTTQAESLVAVNRITDPNIALNESLEDSWLDIAGYGIIGCMFESGTFMLPLSSDVSSLNDSRGEQAVDPIFTAEQVERINGIVVTALVEHGMFPGVTKLERAE